MFTDEHALDYLSPPLWDDYDDELLDLKTINDDTYDDPFYSKEEKIKDCKILIDELDHPKSSIFLPSPECDLVFYEDFSEVDALPSTNNEDKKKVNKLERKRKSRTPGMNLFKIGTSRRRSLDMDEVFEDVEGDAKQVINAAAYEVPTGDAVNTAGTEFNTASALVTTAGVSVSTAKPITIASEVVTTAEQGTPLTITTTTVIEVGISHNCQTLMKDEIASESEKSTVKGVTMQEPSDTATRPTVPPPQHDPKDKGKAKMVEPKKPLKRRDSFKFDVEVALDLAAQMQAELEEEERLAKQREEDANIVEWEEAFCKT
ncbi:hypothetical protein Tco_0945374 [Tanacetum coccineum]